MNLTSRSFFTNMKTFLINLLNEINQNVLIMHESSKNKKIKTEQNFDIFAVYDVFQSKSKFFHISVTNLNEFSLINVSSSFMNSSFSFQNETRFIKLYRAIREKNERFVRDIFHVSKISKPEFQHSDSIENQFNSELIEKNDDVSADEKINDENENMKFESNETNENDSDYVEFEKNSAKSLKSKMKKLILKFDTIK